VRILTDPLEAYGPYLDSMLETSNEVFSAKVSRLPLF
jgi:hypothetical protein